MKSWCNGALGGYKDAVKSAVEIFLAEGPKRGLELSTDHAVQNVHVWCPFTNSDDNC